MRTSEINRVTAETDITLTLELEGRGASDIDTGVGFLDHMLTLFAKHGRFDLKITAKGDNYVDDHHTVEDVGIALGQAFAKALSDKRGIRRYGDCIVPMDEALIMSAVDISGRPYLVLQAEFGGEYVGEFATELVEEFFRAVSFNAGLTLHIQCEYGANDHHKIEAIFKALGRACKQASQIVSNSIQSSKGSLV